MSVQREAFQEFAGEAKEMLGDSLEQLVLYGSVVRREEREDSDVDVFAVVRSEEDKDVLYNLASRVSLEHDTHIALVVRTVEEFELTRETFFTREVMESGEAVV